MPDQETPPAPQPDPYDRPAWARLHLWQMQPVRDVLLGLGILALFWLGQKISVVTVPLLLAILLAYLFEPVIQFAIRRLRMSRPGAVVGIIVGLVLLVVVPSGLGLTYGIAQTVALGSSLVENANAVDEALKTETAAPALSDPASEPTPDARPTVADVRDQLREESGAAWVWIYDTIREGSTPDSESDLAGALEAVTRYLTGESAEQLGQAAAGVAVGTLNRVLGFAATLFGLAFAGFITMFFFFFLATQWVQFKRFVGRLLPDKHEDRIIDLAHKFDHVIAGFVRGRLTIAFIQAIVFSIGYWIIGVPAAFILGPVVAVLSIVPYLALVGVPISIVLLWLENRAGFRGHILWALGAPTAFYFVGQALDDYVWTPLIQGKETGLDTPMILFASLAGGALFGVFGLLIAIPIAACVKILIQEIVWPKFKAWAEGDAADPLPIE